MTSLHLKSRPDAREEAEVMERCPYHSRAWGCRCDLAAGHDGNCCSAGDAFAPGWDPSKGAPLTDTDVRDALKAGSDVRKAAEKTIKRSPRR
jgi:hypothetical protein